MTQTLYLDAIQEIINNRISIFNNTISITDRNTLPSNGVYPLENNNWYKIPNVISIFVDLRNSTGLSAVVDNKKIASVYEFFTGTAIRIFHEMGAEYIDIKGDGVFALFSANKKYRAFASAITFRTFAGEVFMKKIKTKLQNDGVDVGYHIGIDIGNVLVKSVGLRDNASRDDRNNEVWAGKPINMSAKLASISNDGEICVSDRFYKIIDNDKVRYSCGCVGGEQVNNITYLWEKEVDLSADAKFDFNKAHILKSCWCSIHGKEWCQDILNLDD